MQDESSNLDRNNVWKLIARRINVLSCNKTKSINKFHY